MLGNNFSSAEFSDENATYLTIYLLGCVDLSVCMIYVVELFLKFGLPLPHGITK